MGPQVVLTTVSFQWQDFHQREAHSYGKWWCKKIIFPTPISAANSTPSHLLLQYPISCKLSRKMRLPRASETKSAANPDPLHSKKQLLTAMNKIDNGRYAKQMYDHSVCINEVPKLGINSSFSVPVDQHGVGEA